MKQRYTITIADMEINVVSDESPETVESLVGSVDRKMREILVASRRCTKAEAALLCALDYCSDKVIANRKVKQLENTLLLKDAEIQELVKQSEKLRIELETLRESLLAAQATKKEQSITSPEEVVQLSIADGAPAAAAPVKAEPEEEDVFETKAPVEPEDVEFDPTEIFRKAKVSRAGRKPGGRK